MLVQGILKWINARNGKAPEEKVVKAIKKQSDEVVKAIEAQSDQSDKSFENQNTILRGLETKMGSVAENLATHRGATERERRNPS